MINRLKQSLYSYPSQLQKNRLFISEQELRQFWYSCTLVQMEQILTIRQEKLIEHVWSYFNYYITNKKNITSKEVYYIRRCNDNGGNGINTPNINNNNNNNNSNNNPTTAIPSQNILMYCYDCKIFKNTMFSRQDNQMFSCFLLCCRLPEIQVEGYEEVQSIDGNGRRDKGNKGNMKSKLVDKKDSKNKQADYINNSYQNSSNIYNLTELYQFINPNLHYANSTNLPPTTNTNNTDTSSNPQNNSNNPQPTPSPNLQVPTPPQNKILLKCKASTLLKFFNLLKQLNIQPINGDTTILQPHQYQRFIYSWTQYFCHSWDIDNMVRHLFRGFLIIFQNKILLEFLATMSQDEKQYRRYKKPVVIYEKPKLKQSYTMIDQDLGLGDVEWDALKVRGFRLKYMVVEDQKKYVCYRVKDQYENIDDQFYQGSVQQPNSTPTNYNYYQYDSQYYNHHTSQQQQQNTSGVQIYIDPTLHSTTSQQQTKQEMQQQNLKIFQAFAIERYRNPVDASYDLDLGTTPMIIGSVTSSNNAKYTISNTIASDNNKNTQNPNPNHYKTTPSNPHQTPTFQQKY